jgi:hypothetical protein
MIRTCTSHAGMPLLNNVRQSPRNSLTSAVSGSVGRVSALRFFSCPQQNSRSRQPESLGPDWSVERPLAPAIDRRQKRIMQSNNDLLARAAPRSGFFFVFARLCAQADSQTSTASHGLDSRACSTLKHMKAKGLSTHARVRSSVSVDDEGNSVASLGNVCEAKKGVAESCGAYGLSR